MREYVGSEYSASLLIRHYASVAGLPGSLERWEWLAAIDAQTFTLIDCRTDKQNSFVHLGPDVDDHIQTGGTIIVHHNHVTLHSLSSADWFGMATKPEIVENWVHCSDGTRYRGKIRDAAHVIQFCQPQPDGSSHHTRRVETFRMTSAQDSVLSRPEFGAFAVEIAPHFVNKIMHREGWVEYEYELGEHLRPLAERADALRR